MLETIREILERERFVAFQIVVSSGDRFHIENPALVPIGEGMFTYYLPRGNGAAHLRLNQIVLVQVDEH